MMGPKYWVVVTMLAGAAFLLNIRGTRDAVPPHLTLDQFPPQIGNWVGSDQAIDQQTLDVLGKGDFLSRQYRVPGRASSIDLFIAYFASQRTGTTLHSPKNCLPGAGWTFDSAQYRQLMDSSGKSHNVGEYLIGNGDAQAFVIYWYEAHGRSTANEYTAKAHLIADALRFNRTDGGLVRVVTLIGPNESVAQARVRVEAFTSDLMTDLPAFIPN